MIFSILKPDFLYYYKFLIVCNLYNLSNTFYFINFLLKYLFIYSKLFISSSVIP